MEAVNPSPVNIKARVSIITNSNGEVWIKLWIQDSAGITLLANVSRSFRLVGPKTI